MYCVLEVLDEGYVEDVSKKDSQQGFSKDDFDQYICEHQDFPPFAFELKLKMTREKAHSRLNDFLFYIDKGLVISQKVKDILADCILPPHRFYPATVIKNKQAYPYYYFYCFSDALPWLNLNQSKLYFINELDEKIDFTVKNLAGFYQFKHDNRAIQESLSQLQDEKGMPKVGFLKQTLELRRKVAWVYGANELVFGKEFNESLDLFSLSEFSWMRYISDKVGQAFQQANVSGMMLSAIAQHQYIVDRPNPAIRWS